MTTNNQQRTEMQNKYETIEDVITGLQCGMFVTDDSLPEAWQRFLEVWESLSKKDKPAVLTAMCVWNNTLAKTLGGVR